MQQIPAIIAETVRATLTNAVANNIQIPAQQPRTFKKRMSYSNIDRLPTDIRNELIEMLFSKRYTYLKISDKLKSEGHNISKSAVGRYAARILDELDTVGGIDLEY